MSALREDTPELRQWIIRQTEAGHSPQTLLTELISQGYAEDAAVVIMTAALESRVTELVSSKKRMETASEFAPSVPVPQPIGTA